MTQFKIVPFEPAHYVEAAGARRVGLDVRVVAEACAGSGPAFTALVDSEVAACAGLTIPWSGLAEAWAVVTNVGRRHSIFVHRAVIRVLDGLIVGCRLRRVQADVLETFTVGRQWVERLGFAEEFRMPHAGPADETLIRYVRFRNRKEIIQ